ncbi:IclR family transcriptional regulator C-terminal domain-containing protein [uncultured Croceicoccus sp.]|uniref:IclR family transcriptional regulator n=1 Tax=uncultured Croceicoccus sp. TaxID=1295329 RepID=UPI002638262E|nr:IclR family transcriptional regulator C-terminal domain-containing protein [uncultured Croceicoccus sp.]
MSAPSEKPKGKPVGAVVQTIRLLRALSESDAPLGVSAAARAAGINTSTAFNVLRTLTAETLTVFDEPTKTYSLGPGLLDLCGALRQPSLAEKIRAELPELAAKTGRLIALWEVMGTRLILLDRAQSDRPVRLDLDLTQRMPRYLGAVGRAAAAADGLGKAALKKEFGKLRWAGDISPADYVESVELARQQGYGVDRGALYEGIVAIASVVTDTEGKPVLGLSAIEFAERLNEDDIAATGKMLADVTRHYSAD